MAIRQEGVEAIFTGRRAALGEEVVDGRILCGRRVSEITEGGI